MSKFDIVRLIFMAIAFAGLYGFLRSTLLFGAIVGARMGLERRLSVADRDALAAYGIRGALIFALVIVAAIGTLAFGIPK